MNQKFALILSFLLATTLLNSQITIGSAKKPSAGTLLMLDDGTDKDGANAKKGLGLPRVILTDLTKLTIGENTDPNQTVIPEADWAKHTGLMVYNVEDAVWDHATCTYIGPHIGLHVWDGTTWQGLGIEDDHDKDLRTVTDDGSKITLSYNGEVTEYRYSSFGAAGIWMTENLATQYLPNGTELLLHTANSYIDPQYFIGNPNGSITGKEGLLYNWAAVLNRKVCDKINQEQAEAGNPIPGDNEVESQEETSPGAKDGKIKGICPTGWHLPSDREFNQLEKEIATNASLYTQTPMSDGQWIDDWETIKHRRGTHSPAMKSTTKVANMDPLGDSKPADSGGFDMLLAGTARYGSAPNYGGFGSLWSSSSNGLLGGWIRGMHLHLYSETVQRLTGFGYELRSIRCKKD